MADVVQVFCKIDPSPTLQQVVEFLSEEGFDARFDEAEIDESEMENPAWAEAALFLGEDERNLQLMCFRNDDSDEFTDLVDELTEELDGREGPEVKRVLKHLKRAVFVFEISLVEGSEEEVTAQSALVNLLVAHYGGLLFVPEEGFYDSDDLIVGMD